MVRYAFYCANCCLWCVERILKFISKNAYIQTAIHGSSFCHAAKEGFYLVCRNILRIGALHVVSGFVLLIAKVAVTVFAGVGAYWIFTGSFDVKINGYMGPTILVMIIAWTFSGMFMVSEIRKQCCKIR